MNDATVEWTPLTFRPVYKDYIWGGQRIINKFGRAGPGGIVAESWEVSTRPEGMSVVAAGPFADRTLQELIDALGADLLGRRAPAGRFPLLVKLIDAREQLSVQVHPDVAGAARHGGEPKTEAWHVLDANPGSQIYAGLHPGVDRCAMEDAIRHTRIEDTLARVPVRAGDTVFIPGGTVHALDAGLLILEVQQNSNTTYRLYDWGRVGHDGRPRETHLAEALAAIRWDVPAGGAVATPRPLPCPPPASLERLVECPFFVLDRLRLPAQFDLPDDPGGFRVLFVAEGGIDAIWSGGAIRLAAGTTALLPAALRGVAARPASGAATVMLVSLP